MRTRLWMLRQMLGRFESTMFTRTRYSQPKMVAIGVMGAFSLVAYYPVWAYLFPQPYENLWLRIIGSVMFVPLALIRWWPRAFRKWLPTYWYATATVTLSFFIGYMSLRNCSPAWLMTHLASVMLLMMLFDMVSFAVIFSFGTLMAVLVFMIGPHILPDGQALLEYVPLLMFGLVGGAVCSVSQNIAEQTRVDALTTASDNIAHELRTPLGSLGIAGQAVQRFLPELLRSHRLAIEASLPVTELREAHLKALERSLDVMHHEVNHANTVIDMLLLAARPIGKVPLSLISARHCVDQAVSRYPYASRAEQDRVSVQADTDFDLKGSDTLLVHVVFNLLRNALYQTGKAGKGVITIAFETGEEENLIRVRDTGPGIAPDILPRIFNRFFSHSDDRRGVAGLGIGLAFSRAAMEHMGGTIEVRSQWREFTEFTLRFPLPDSDWQS